MGQSKDNQAYSLYLREALTIEQPGAIDRPISHSISRPIFDFCLPVNTMSFHIDAEKIFNHG